MPVLERPKALGPELALTSIDDVDNALHELAWCEHQEAAIDAETKQLLDKLKKDREPLKHLAIEGAQTTHCETISARAACLEAAIKEWANAHLNEYLAKGSKTLKLPHGEVAYKLQPLAIGYAEGATEKTVVAAIEQKSKLGSFVLSLLKKAKLGSFALSQLVRLTPSLDKDGIKAAWDAAPKSRATLKGLGIIVTGGDDQVVVAPAKHVTAKP